MASISVRMGLGLDEIVSRLADGAVIQSSKLENRTMLEPLYAHGKGSWNKRLGGARLLPFRFFRVETSLAHAVRSLCFELAFEELFQRNPLALML